MMARDHSEAGGLLREGEHVRLRLGDLAVGGEAVARHEGMAVFAAGGAPGDLAEVEITQVAQRYARGRVVESTYVCVAELASAARQEWETSRVRRKLARVLWVPVEAARVGPLAERHLGTPLLWTPSPEQEAQLREDFGA